MTETGWDGDLRLPPDDPMQNANHGAGEKQSATGGVLPAHGTAVATAFDVMRRRLTLLETRCRGLELRVRELETDR